MLRIQTPYSKNYKTLINYLREIFLTEEKEEKMVHFYGAFAFATKDGVTAVFKDHNFSSIELIVGLDAITNQRCVEYLTSLNNLDSNFNILGVISPKKRTIFHPKFCIATNKDKNKGFLLIGSGNLTMGGLQNNTEAYTKINIDKTEIDSLLKTWDDWKQDLSENGLYPIDDKKITEQAKENNRKIIKKETKTESTTQENTTPENDSQKFTEMYYDGWVFNQDCSLLIAEIPKSGNRWNQVNISKQIFESFFHAPTTNTNNTHARHVYLKHFNPTKSTLEDIEIRKLVTVKSQNYRIELAAAKNLTYPENINNGRPIVIFVEINNSQYLYSLYMPDNESYNKVNKLMNTLKGETKKNTMQRKLSKVKESTILKKLELYKLHEKD